jgi:hypothetical protein
MHAHRLVTAALALALISSATGCVARKPEATTSPDDPAGRATCFDNQLKVEEQVFRAMLEKPGVRIPLNYGQLKGQGLIEELLWCPAGGDLVWDPTSYQLGCSVHGHHP